MKIKISIFAVMLVISLILYTNLSIAVILFPALLHELGHIFAARCRRVRISSLTVDVLGARITLAEQTYSYSDEIIICACGPLVNLVCAALCYIYTIRFGNNEYLDLFISSSLSLGIVNLLPIRTFDGGRIIRGFLIYFIDYNAVEKLLSVISFLLLFSIWCFSVYLLLRSSSSLSLFIFSISMFKNIFIEKNFE